MQEGDRFPSVKVKMVTKERPKDISTDEVCQGEKSVLFAVPGAFSPVSSEQHLHGFDARRTSSSRRTWTGPYCVALNDAFVMDAWGEDSGVGDAVRLFADGSAELAKALGLEMDATKAGLGMRAQRFAIIVDEGVAKRLALEGP